MARPAKGRPAKGQVVERETKRGRVFALRFHAYGKREYVTLGTGADGWTRERADQELANVLADVRRGIWRPPELASVVEAPKEEETFHEFASRWLEAHRLGVKGRTVEFWRWALEMHLLGFFAKYPVSQITVELVDGYTTAKARARELLLADLERWQAADPDSRGPRPRRPLSNSSINRTLRVLAQILDDAVEYGHLASNPARGRKRRLKTKKPRRIWLELDEVRSLLDAAGQHRALLATMMLAGLRVGELCSLRWRAVDLACGTLTVEESKTDAGEGRRIELTPMLLEELKLHRAANSDPGRDDLVFPTLGGRQRYRHNVRSRLLLPALARANKTRLDAGVSPIGHVTNHTLRRTFASLLYEAGATPALVMDQMGHSSAALALEVYAKKMRNHGTAARMDELVRGADWALMGTNGAEDEDALSADATEKPRISFG